LVLNAATPAGKVGNATLRRSAAQAGMPPERVFPNERADVTDCITKTTRIISRVIGVLCNHDSKVNVIQT
jgi:hypothetical protein